MPGRAEGDLYSIVVIPRLDRGIQNPMEKNFYVYIMASQRNGTLYVGVASNLIKRVWEHKNKLLEGFAERYAVTKLVYYEYFLDAENAIRREKRLKKYNRKWKMDLIEEANPEWADLYEVLMSGFPGQAGE
jgi:putative endonuclease